MAQRAGGPCWTRWSPARTPASASAPGLRSGDLDAIYLTGGSSALRPFQHALRKSFAGTLVEGDLFGGVATGLAYAARGARA
jgi:hypothetical chaperone protein